MNFYKNEYISLNIMFYKHKQSYYGNGTNNIDSNDKGNF